MIVSGPMKTVIYVGLAGTLIVGVYPQPVIDWVVAATMMFSDLAGPAAALPSVPLVIPSGG